MFDSVVAAVSPSRTRLAGPVAALAHGVVFAGLIGAALWNAAELPLPDPPERVSWNFAIPIALSGPSGGGGGGGRQDARTSKGQQKAAVRANSFPSSLPDEVARATEPELTDGEGPRQGPGESDNVGLSGDKEGLGFGDCPDCPVGLERGDVVDGSVVAPILVRRVEPNYPEALRKLRLEGRVILEAIIGRNGSIEEIRVVSSGNVLFTEEAVKAVGQWRYEPCLFAGRPVRVRLVVTVAFRLN
jgi:TonB family protein